MLTTEKPEYRTPVVRTAKEGKVPFSIDSQLRNKSIEINPWNSIYLLGAQLSRPPYDPYREIVETKLSIGRGERRLLLDEPIILDGQTEEANKTNTSVSLALNNLAHSGKMYGLISRYAISRDQRHYALILTYNADQNAAGVKDADAINTPFDVSVLRYLRRAVDVPIIVTTKNPAEIEQILGKEPDAVIFYASGTEIEKIRGIVDAKKVFADFFKGEDITRQLIVRGIPNDTGTFVKAIAMGAISANAVVYEMPVILADILETADIPDIPSRENIATLIENYLRATHVEITQLVAAAGYSRYDNVSHADLRTLSPDVSMASGIAMEGLNVSWAEYHQRILLKILGTGEIKLPDTKLEKMTKELIQRLRGA